MLVLFWIFTILMLGFGVGVIAFRNPVSSAMSLVMSFISLAALFVTLNAYFIGIIQVLVYAGAVMVLFLFIIMLLDLKAEICRRIKVFAFFGGGLVLIGFTYLLGRVVSSLPESHMPLSPTTLAMGNDVTQLGMTLFTRYNMPFQILGILLLVATIGVVVLSRKELK